MPSPSLELQRKNMPHLPGVYVFRDRNGNALYVGKAKSLRNRVNSHFTNPSTRGGESLLELSYEIDYIVTDSEWEALVLEQAQITQLDPKFNVKLRGGSKKYPWIAISLDEEYPRVYLSYEERVKGRAYYGPYNGRWARQVLALLGKVYQYRTCQGPAPGRASGSPCLDYFIKRCGAPCVDYISKEEYRQKIEAIMAFLEGKWKQAAKDMRAQMQDSASLKEYEQAAVFRNRLHEIEQLLANQVVISLDSGSQEVDIIGLAVDKQEAHAQVFKAREGGLRERHSFVLTNPAAMPLGEVAYEFILSHYTQATHIPPQIIVPPETSCQEDLCSLLSEKRSSKVEVKPAQRGEKRRLYEMAQTNARMASKRANLKRSLEGSDDQSKSTERLAQALDLDHVPSRIECFDISNVAGTHTVASMVVFEDGIAKKEHYRNFVIKTVEGSDDFASMKEVVGRRVSQWNLQQELVDAPEKDQSFAAQPDLIIIDGGKGQLSAALPELGDFMERGTTVIALAKRLEEVWLPEKLTPVMIDVHDPALHLLQRARDEAHRFAITHHRKRRGKAMLVSSLDQIPGLGPKRKRDLIDYFGSPAKVKQATVDELEKVVPQRLATSIYATFHSENDST